MKENRFAFLIHPINRSHFLGLMQQSKKTSCSFLTLFTEERSLFPSSHILTLPFSFNAETRVVCDVILCPLLPEQMVSDEERALSKILNAVSIANRLGAQLIGLGGFTSIVGGGGLTVASCSPVPVTSGNTYTAATVVQAIIRIAEVLNINLSNSCIAIIGATGDIGTACTVVFADLFGKVILVARNDERLQALAQHLKLKRASIYIEKRAAKAAAAADVVITVTSALTTLIDAKDLKTNAIVCDVSYPANVVKEILLRERSDILVFEGGIVSSDHFLSQISPESLFWKFNPISGMHACFAETLLLALENKFNTYSIGRGNISSEKMSEISTIAMKYGFYPVLPSGNFGSSKVPA